MPRDPLIVGRIPTALRQRVLDEAARTGTTTSAILRDALSAHLPNDPNAPNPTRTPTRADPPARRLRVAGNLRTSCTHRVQPGSYCKRCERII